MNLTTFLLEEVIFLYHYYILERFMLQVEDTILLTRYCGFLLSLKAMLENTRDFYKLRFNHLEQTYFYQQKKNDPNKVYLRQDGHISINQETLLTLRKPSLHDNVVNRIFKILSAQPRMRFGFNE